LHLRNDDSNIFGASKETGIPALFAPSSEIYFEWKRSPILQQFLYMYEIGKGSGNNEYAQGHETKKGGGKSNASIPIRFYYENPGIKMEKEKVMDELPMHTFDLWWIYLYAIKQRYIGFIVFSVLFGMASLHGIQLILLSKREI
jgi:hypothetical protein